MANCEPLSRPVTSLLKRHIESHIDNYDSNNNAFLSYNKESSMITVNIPNLIDVLAFVKAVAGAGATYLLKFEIIGSNGSSTNEF